MTRLLRRLRDVFAPAARDRDMQQELQLHLESLVREYREAGMSEEAAEQAARRRFGSVASIKDRGHDVRGVGWLEDWLRELRHAARRLVRTPAFTLATVATLALAIGANAAIFTLVHRVVLNPLPYPESGRLIDVDHGSEMFNAPSGIGMKIGLYPYYRERARTLDDLAVFRTQAMTLSGQGEPERARVTSATTSLTSVLRVSPGLGRWFAAEEGVPGAPPVAVLSHGLWTRRYGGDPEVLGQSVTLDGVPAQVIGVMPASFAFPDSRTEVWLAEAVTPEMALGIWTYSGVARLRDGATVADVREELNTLIADVPRVFAGDPLAQATGPDVGVMSTARTLKEAAIGDIARLLWLLLASVGLLLMVACANVANLFLVRSDARQREVAVRRALGAGRVAIARLFFAESVWLAAAGGVGGVALAWVAVRLLVAAAPANLPRLTEVHLDGVVVVFACLLSLLAALLFSAAPLVRGGPLAPALHDRGRANTHSRSRQTTRHVLMGAQVALALVLLMGSGLMVRSFLKLRAVDPRFDASAAVTFQIGLPDRDYPTRDAAVRAHRALIERMASLPGVTAASASTCLPLDGGCFGNGVVVEGREAQQLQLADTSLGSTSFRAVAGGYFEAMGIGLLRGRGIERGDVERREPIAVVDERFVDLVFANENPIGRRVTWSAPPAPGEGTPRRTWLTIVGVVPNVPTRALGETRIVPQLYMPVSLTGEFGAPPWEYIGPGAAAMGYIVRARALSGDLLPSIRRAVDAVDPSLAMAQVSTLEDRIDRASAQMAFTMALLVIAAGVALLLGLVGIYGVVAYIVSQRTSEIGVRLALGAEPGGVVALIVRQGGLVTLAGVAVGLAGALAGSRLIESLLYEVSPRDPVVFVATALALLAVALVACWLPARRAARISPVEALRAD